MCMWRAGSLNVFAPMIVDYCFEHQNYPSCSFLLRLQSLILGTAGVPFFPVPLPLARTWKPVTHYSRAFVLMF